MRINSLRPVMGVLETQFQKDAFAVLQQALLDSGIRLILAEPDWQNPRRWSDEERIIPEALSKIGMLYYKQTPN